MIYTTMITIPDTPLPHRRLYHPLIPLLGASNTFSANWLKGVPVKDVIQTPAGWGCPQINPNLQLAFNRDV